jgi:hypothetical protein
MRVPTWTSQNATEEGIAFIPRDPELFRKTLPWPQRIAMRNGGGEVAHVGTVMLWTTRVGVPRDGLLRGIHAELVRAARFAD